MSFNPRTHTGCDTTAGLPCQAVRCFNPRTHTGCDTAMWAKWRPSCMFQSTHPHGVRHGVRFCARPKHGVSIHAPTRGATRPDHDKLPDHIKFQSTHPHGVRPSRWCPASSKRRSFNPRTHTGCDAGFNATCAIYWRFQSTHPHGVRLETRPIVTFYIRFQSTHPHGVRLANVVFITPASAMFQSTHPHGVRPCCACALSHRRSKFQSTHPHGVRQVNALLDNKPLVRFNPRTHTGCDTRCPYLP